MRRLELGLLQREVAERLGVDKTTVYSWEGHRTVPAQWQWPQIIAFLGNVPFSQDGSLADRLGAYRRKRGLSEKGLARILRVDPSTVLHWERGEALARREHARRIAELLHEDEPVVYRRAMSKD